MLVNKLRSSLQGSSASAALLQQHLHTSALAQATNEWFTNVPMAKKDAILGVTENFLADENPEKINLGVVRSLARLSQY